MSGRKDLLDALSALFRLKNDVVGIAISLPGIIDAENGYIVMGGALRYNDDFYLRHELYAHCRVPMIIENDANCAGLAEATLGSLKDIKEGYVIVLGTMIGGAYIKDRKVQRGHHFAAGEISYINTLRDEVPTEESIWGNRCGTAGLCARYAIKKGLPVNSVDGYVFFAEVAERVGEIERRIENGMGNFADFHRCFSVVRLFAGGKRQRGKEQR